MLFSSLNRKRTDSQLLQSIRECVEGAMLSTIANESSSVNCYFSHLLVSVAVEKFDVNESSKLQGRKSNSTVMEFLVSGEVQQWAMWMVFRKCTKLLSGEAIQGGAVFLPFWLFFSDPHKSVQIWVIFLQIFNTIF